MKKTLVALAALAAVGAYAQSNVTLYGVMEATADLGYSLKTDNGTNTTKTKPSVRLQDGASQGVGASRIGFKGTEDLGGGMKANFQLEAGVAIDTGVTGGNSPSAGTVATFARQAWVGLSSSAGEVRLGRQYLPSYFVRARSEAADDSNGLYDAASIVSSYVGGGSRADNTIAYYSPSMSGFKVSGAYVAPESKTQTYANATPGTLTAASKSNPQYNLALEYSNGPVYVGFAYDSRKSGSDITATPDQTKVTGYNIGGSYDFGAVKPFVNYTRIKTTLTNADFGTTSTTTPLALFNNGGIGLSTTTTGGAAIANLNGEYTEKAYSLGVKVPMGAVTWIAGYGRNKIQDTLTLAAGGNFAIDLKTTAYQVGAQYSLSKRTMFEANYGRQTVKGTTPTNFGGTGVHDNKLSALNFGVRHSF